MLPAGRSARRRLAVAALAAVPTTVALALPAAAAAPVTPAPQQVCGVALLVEGLSAGVHTVTVSVTSRATGERVPVVTGEPVAVVPDEPAEGPADPDGTDPEADGTGGTGTDEGSTDEGSTDEGSADEGSADEGSDRDAATAEAAEATSPTASAPDDLAPEGPATADGALSLIVTTVTATPQTSPPAPGSPVPAPGTEVVRDLTAGQALVLPLDAAAVPDDDVRLRIAVRLDGTTSLQADLAVPACGAPPAGPAPTPDAEGEPVPSASPAGPGPTTPQQTPPVAGEVPRTSPAVPVPAVPVPAVPVPAVPVPAVPVPAVPVPAVPVPAVPVTAGWPAGEQTTTDDASGPALGSVLGGTGESGYLALSTLATAPQGDAAPAAPPVPTPVIAPPVGGFAAAAGTPGQRPSPLDVLLAAPVSSPAGGDQPVLAAPELATAMTSDPVADLAPAAFVLSALLGGMLMTRRRSAV